VVDARAEASGEEAWRTAPVVLEVYSDFQCPVCGRFVREQLPRVIDDFVIPGIIRVVDHPIAIVGQGTPNESIDSAVGAVCAARQERYWDYHGLLMWNQHGENRGAFGPGTLAGMADEIGLSRTAWDACANDPAVSAGVRDQTARAAAAGISQTPTFVLNGRRIVGLYPYAELAAAIRSAAGAISSSPAD